MRNDEIRLDIPVHAVEYVCVCVCVGWAAATGSISSYRDWYGHGSWSLVTTGLQLRYVLLHVLFIYITTHTRNKT